MPQLHAPRITSFLVKIASRCNLACDYCYMYEHADQSWRNQPALMTDATIRLLAERIAEYAREVALTHLLLIFHGGEPLLAGAERIVDATTSVRRAVPPGMVVDATLQTNGTLLKISDLQLFHEHRIGVSVSIDGDLAANDFHRMDHAGRSTFDATFRAIHELQNFPDIYGGLICVIDPRVPAKRLLDFFSRLSPPNLDLLLPDANYLAPPPGRDNTPLLYKDWLLEAFDLWFDNYSEMRVRTFDSLLESIAGLPSNTDAFGFGDISMLTIETDGTYHDLDVLKITTEGATSLGLRLDTSSIAEVASSPQIQVRRKLLTQAGLASECITCPEVAICGGGSVPHRFDSDGFQHRTVYCTEMLALIQHARGRLRGQLVANRFQPSNDAHLTLDETATFDQPFNSSLLRRLYAQESERQKRRLLEAINSLTGYEAFVEDIKAAPVDRVNQIAIQPSVVFWSTLTSRHHQSIQPRDIDGDLIPRHDEYVKVIHSWIVEGPPPTIRIHRNDEMLRLPFGAKIVFESGSLIPVFEQQIEHTLQLIGVWNPDLLSEMKWVSPEVQFIIDTTADSQKAVSFSDNAVPGALYISMQQGNETLGVYDLADSLIHEHRHQRLYLLQATAPIVAYDMPFVRSPWREEPRPPSGLFHAVYVFCGLIEWWQYVSMTTTGSQQVIAQREVRSTAEKLQEAFPILRSTSLTPIGRTLVDSLEARFRESVE